LNSFRTGLGLPIIAFKLVSLLLQKQPVCEHQMIIVEQGFICEVFLVAKVAYTVVRFHSANSMDLLKNKSKSQ
jgi:hypothetical protein